MDPQLESALEQESPMFVQTARGASSASGVRGVAATSDHR